MPQIQGQDAKERIKTKATATQAEETDNQVGAASRRAALLLRRRLTKARKQYVKTKQRVQAEQAAQPAENTPPESAPQATVSAHCRAKATASADILATRKAGYARRKLAQQAMQHTSVVQSRRSAKHLHQWRQKLTEAAAKAVRALVGAVAAVTGSAMLLVFLIGVLLVAVIIIFPASGVLAYESDAAEAEKLIITDERVLEVIFALPADLDEDRRAVVCAACTLVGKVPYFWGGKSLELGWDSRWNEMTEVSAPEDKTTGTVQPFGLDCSGFVDWVFYNATGGKIILSGGGGAEAQYRVGQPIPWEDAQPGDLAFYPEYSHVGIVVGRAADGSLLICHCAAGIGEVAITGEMGFVELASVRRTR